MRILSREDGLGMVEAVVATGVISVAVAGMAGAMTMGIGITGASKQRSAAAALAAERIERARNLPYDQVALDPAEAPPAHDPDTEHPDHQVSLDGTSYAVDATHTERLVPPAGVLRHIEDPVLVGTTELYVYQYVTWADTDGDGIADDLDANGQPDFKRVTAVISWRRTQNAGVGSRLVSSTFVGTNTIALQSVSPAPSATPSPAPTASPTPSSSPSPTACPGDTDGPSGSLTISSGAGAETGYTSSQSISEQISAGDACAPLTASLSNDGAAYTDVATLTTDVPSTVVWSVPAGDGPKTVYGRFRDAAGNLSPVLSSSIVLDRTLPVTPASLRKVVCSLDGTTRHLTTTWDPSTDANMRGYRVYRSINSAPFAAVGTTSSASFTDSTPKGHDSVRYLARAYDKAGNESADSNTLTFTKNHC